MTDKMTDEEKRQRMNERNAAICAFYAEGHKLAEVCSRFQLGRQRVLQILKQAGVWRPYEKGDRTKFLGVSVTKETKDGLTQLAAARNASVSRLVSDVLDKTVEEAAK